jgi:hypothetical protein
MKNWKSCPENWKIREKLKVLFCDGFMHDSFFCFVRYSREKVFRKKNRDNYKGKSKNSGKLQKL